MHAAIRPGHEAALGRVVGDREPKRFNHIHVSILSLENSDRLKYCRVQCIHRPSVTFGDRGFVPKIGAGAEVFIVCQIVPTRHGMHGLIVRSRNRLRGVAHEGRGVLCAP